MGARGAGVRRVLVAHVALAALCYATIGLALHDGRGALAIVSCALFWANYAVMNRRLRAALAREEGRNDG